MGLTTWGLGGSYRDTVIAFHRPVGSGHDRGSSGDHHGQSTECDDSAADHDLRLPLRGPLHGWAGAGHQGDMATVTELGQAGLQGWREKVADGISQPVAKRAPLEEDQVRAFVGAAFFVLAVIYVVKTISAVTRQARGG